MVRASNSFAAVISGPSPTVAAPPPEHPADHLGIRSEVHTESGF